jgi:hypothetical protein
LAEFAEAYFYLDGEDDGDEVDDKDRDSDSLFQRVAAIRARREQEEEESTRVERGLAWLAAVGAERSIGDEDLVQRLARQFEGLPSAVAREILTAGLRDPTSARASVAVAKLRLNLQSADARFPEPRTATMGLVYSMARRARTILNGMLSENDARELLEKAGVQARDP